MDLFKHTEKEEGREQEKDEIFSRSVKTKRRTYFFDVRETKSGERYLTIAESRKYFDNEQGNFFFKKHKIFLYSEDVEKFLKELNTSLRFVETGDVPIEEEISNNDDTVDFMSFDSDLDRLKIK